VSYLGVLDIPYFLFPLSIDIKKVEEHQDTQCAFFGESMLSQDVEPASIIAHGDVVVMCLPEQFLTTIEKWKGERPLSTLYDLELADLVEAGLLGKGSFGVVSMVIFITMLPLFLPLVPPSLPFFFYH
jgi:hypothetical protein